MDPKALTDAILNMKWLPLAILVVGYLARLFNDESKFPASVPARWHPVIVVALGQLLAILLMVFAGSGWKVAVVTGLVTSLFTMGLFDLVVKALFNGKVPWWIDILALIFPPKKPSDDTSPKP